MYRKLLNITGRALLFSGVFSALCKIKKNSKMTLVYHNPETQVIATHFEFLKKHGTLLNIHSNGTSSNTQHGRANRLGFIFCFDDGYVGYKKLATFFSDRGVAVCMYITTGAIGTKRRFWWELIDGKLNANHLKECSDEFRLEQLKKTYNWSDHQDFPDQQNLELADLKTLRDHGMILAAHTVTHPILSRCTKQKSEGEIVESIEYLRDKLGVETLLFAYPNGREADFGERELASLSSMGIQFARTTTWGMIDKKPGDHNFRQPGTIIFDDASIYELVARIAGIDHVTKLFYKFYKRLIDGQSH